MSFERLNYFILAVVLSCFTALFIGTAVDGIYFGFDKTNKRGYSVEVVETETSSSNTGETLIELGFLMAEATAEAGAKIATRCALCHTFNKGEPNKVGPNLWNIVNSKPASKDGFSYSNAMKANTKPWSIEHLAVYIHAPQKVVPGTKMSFAGIKNEKELAALLVYLSTLNDQKIAIPSKDLKITV